jgi:DNA mismatch repair protein MutS
LLKQLEVASLAGFGCEEKPLGIGAAGALLNYLDETQRQALPHLRRLSLYSRADALLIDPFTRRNLELTQSLRDGSAHGTLLEVLDHTRTPPGARLLRRWLVAPSRDLSEIRRRQEAVAEFIAAPFLRRDLDGILKNFGDLERLSARLACERVLPRELISLKGWLMLVPRLKETLKDTHSAYLAQVEIGNYSAIVERIEKTLIDDPPSVMNEGGLIKSDVNPELDELRALSQDAKCWIGELQERERRRTHIPNLKVGYNSVFGYYIEVTRSHLNSVPKDYIRRQTLTGAERFITPELKDYESKVLNAESRIRVLEYELFLELRREISGYGVELQLLSQLIARLDVLLSLAQAAIRNEYIRPVLDESAEIIILEGRHPVVERSSKPFIPNDTQLDLNSDQILLITGPNMAGKSTYLRQVALIVIMAQMGGFVPAREARIGLVDKIFTRIGASDDLSRGVSTFLAEMMETANILNNATPKSLLILDEIGRGTATYDGLAIAWAVVEYLHQNPKLHPRTLFATHYHELTDIARFLPRVKNYNFLVKEHKDQVIFLRKLAPGRANRSYGIEVARLAGLPPEVLNRAKEVLADFEHGAELSMSSLSPERSFQLSLFYPMEHPILEEMRKLKLDHLSPIQALNLLAQWQEQLQPRPNQSPE